MSTGIVRVVVESPYAGDVEENIYYARQCLKDSLRRGEAPIASHLLYTQENVLDDNVPAERALGIEAGLQWGLTADKAVFYIDRGMSKGMEAALDRYTEVGVPTELRSLATPILLGEMRDD